jgi:hypothetical protein
MELKNSRTTCRIVDEVGMLSRQSAKTSMTQIVKNQAYT